MLTSRPVGSSRRAALEARIEQLIALLDSLDGDQSLEPELAGFNSDCMDDREGDDEREWDPAGDGIGDADGLAEQASGYSVL